VRVVLPRLVARFTEEKLLAYSLYVGAVGFLLAPFSGSAIILALISFVFGLGMGCGQPLVLMLMFSRSAPGRSGATLGLRLTVNNLMRAIGPPAFGLIGTAFGLVSVFWINAVMMGAGGVLSHPRKVR
jgi:predicted MFS family arabinose efflux permease